jgi:hypothetical protein
MDVSWPSALRTVGAYCLGSLFAGKRSQDKSTDTDNLVVPRENAWRKVARCARPLVLTIAAGLAFGALLRFHNAKFEDGMVRSFQRQQLDTTRSLAGSVEESVANIRSSLASLASHPLPYILLMTSHTNREGLLRIVVAGVDDYLLKPFEPLDLKIRLRTAVRIVDLEEQLRTTVA